MKTFEKIFGETKISWKLLVVYSVVTAVIVALLNCIPALENTSFINPAVTLEYWFVAALFVIVNCKSAKEAAIKTFVFFLISQPLIYLVEVPFKADGWGLFRYYPYWGRLTFLTLPGAWIAYQAKHDNILGAIILSAATGFLLFTGIEVGLKLPETFPRQLVTMIFCLTFAVILIQVILKKKKTRMIAYICSILMAAALLFMTNYLGGSRTMGMALDETHQWEIVETDTDAKLEGAYLNITSKTNGTFYVTVQNEEGEKIRYEAEFTTDRMTLDEGTVVE